ncbi:MAG TPA: hypothetical protein VM871_07415 [Flavisolibacter sp.]|jgi:hypothetical protein|nr:hypothetical protein [Flavisolibacter sp.]
MKNYAFARAVNKITILLLLAGSAYYHITHDLGSAEKDNASEKAFYLPRAAFRNACFPSPALPVYLPPFTIIVINHKPTSYAQS